jgi:hypothetical protein
MSKLSQKFISESYFYYNYVYPIEAPFSLDISLSFESYPTYVTFNHYFCFCGAASEVRGKAIFTFHSSAPFSTSICVSSLADVIFACAIGSPSKQREVGIENRQTTKSSLCLTFISVRFSQILQQ